MSFENEQSFIPKSFENPKEDHQDVSNFDLEKIKEASKGDLEVFDYFIREKIHELIEKRKKGEITSEQLREQRKILDAQVDYEDFSNFKQQELIDAFGFDGDDDERREILKFIQGKESVSQKGANQQAIFDLPSNRILKIVSGGNYPYELPMVKLTKYLENKNVIKTHDVFKENGLVYIVQDKASGKHVDEYAESEREAIPQEHYDELVRLVNMYAAQGIMTDPSKISNLFYDPQQGFSVIDLGAATYQGGLEYNISHYFTKNLSKQKIEKAIEKFGEYNIKPILPTIKEKLAQLSLS
jgi:hypothetical protein